MLDLDVFDRASLHGEKIVAFINAFPVNDLPQLCFEDHVKPDAHTAPVAFPKGMSDVHLDIFFHNLIKGFLRHAVDIIQRGLQVHEGGKSKIAFG